MDKTKDLRPALCLLDRRDLHVLAAGLDNRLRGRELAAFSAHLLACAACRDAVRDLRCILSSPAVPPPPRGLARRVLRSMGLRNGPARRGVETSVDGAPRLTLSRKGD